MHSLPSCRRWAGAVAVLALAACSTPPAPTDQARTPAPTATTAPAAEHTAAVPATPDDLGTAFSTRHARFQPIAFSALPGWGDDSVRDSLAAFRHSCTALARRPAWQALCAQLDGIAALDDAALRRHFEQYFHAYAVLDANADDEGVITGYYEPILNGSRQRSARYAHPVYAIPADLRFLDARQVRDGQQVWLRLDQRQLVPVPAHEAGAKPYVVQLDGLTPGIRDKRYRVRIDDTAGQAVIRPYWPRQVIEQRRLDAQVLAWVDDAYALYSMQIQGSGKIRLDDGDEIVRVAYGEQNGHPFLPQVARRDSAAVSTAVKTRGLQTGGAANADSMTPASPADEDVQRIIAALGGAAVSSRPPAASPTTSPAPRPAASLASGESTPSVDAIIAALQGRAPASSATPAATATTAATATGSTPPAGARAGGEPTGIPDPSYVFFRRIPDGPHGPLGALGVPLTAGRSIAVDPRTTPLGFPVFLSTTHASEAALNRLVFAQDTGGAIRGSVRADYFWGSGQQAGQQAARMKSAGRMWLLMPRAQEITALSTMRTRSAAGGRAAGPLADCVIADEELCVEDWATDLP